MDSDTKKTRMKEPESTSCKKSEDSSSDFEETRSKAYGKERKDDTTGETMDTSTGEKESTEMKKDVESSDSSSSESSDKKEKAGYELDPQDAAAEAGEARNTVTPGKQTGQKQDTQNNMSGIPSERYASGDPKAGPAGTSYHGKSEDNFDFEKSPLFSELNNVNDKIESFQKSMSVKLDATIKSFNDRTKDLSAKMDQIDKMMKSLQKFYNAPFYKAQTTDPADVSKAAGQSVEDLKNAGKIQKSS